MRRPLKPFITEYKTASRRQPTSFSEQPVQDAEKPAARLFEAWPEGEGDNSYEAAMRAADALFSGSRPGPQAAPASTDAPAAPANDKPGGRILRAIDEPPPPEYAALEALHAPKRRGRKPGSKNKPKVPAVAAADVEAPAAVAQPHATPPRVEAPAPVAAPATRQVRALTAGAPRTGVRYSWVRDQLRPGEEWKRRRLPRVCWKWRRPTRVSP